MTGHDPFDWGDSSKKVQAAQAAAGTRNLDVIAAMNMKSAGKGRVKKPNFKNRAKEFYESQGMKYEHRELCLWINGAPMSCDYLGLFDGVIMEDCKEVIGIQVTSKDGATSHIRKMCSTGKCLAGNRRKNLTEWLASGKRAVIIYFYQENGAGSRWRHAEREVTMADVEAVSEGRKVYLKG